MIINVPVWILSLPDRRILFVSSCQRWRSTRYNLCGVWYVTLHDFNISRYSNAGELLRRKNDSRNILMGKARAHRHVSLSIKSIKFTFGCYGSSFFRLTIDGVDSATEKFHFFRCCFFAMTWRRWCCAVDSALFIRLMMRIWFDLQWYFKLFTTAIIFKCILDSCDTYLLSTDEISWTLISLKYSLHINDHLSAFKSLQQRVFVVICVVNRMRLSSKYHVRRL